MTLKEFEAILKEKPELKQKLKEAKKKITDNAPEALSKIVKDMGFDVPASEFKLDEIMNQEISDEELVAVSGGSGDCERVHAAIDNGTCVSDYVDTDCFFNDCCDGLITRYDLCKRAFWIDL